MTGWANVRLHELHPTPYPLHPTQGATVDRLLYALSMLGVVVNACSGALTAGRRKLDWLGVLVIATVTAIGGGTLRDVLLGRYPIFWIRDPNYILASLAAAVGTLAVTPFA